MPSPTYATFASHNRIIEIIKLAERATKSACRGNVLWMLTPFPAGSSPGSKPRLTAFLVCRITGGWKARELKYWEERYLTCPLSYIRASRPVHLPSYLAWTKKVEQYYTDLGKKQKKYRKERQEIELGDLIKLNYSNVPDGMVIEKTPLIVLHGDHRYKVHMRAFRGWIAHAREKRDGA